MNRTIIQASLLILFVSAITVGVNAQVSQQYRADIPFSFDANGKSYEAGKYSVGPLSQLSMSGIAIRGLGKESRSGILGSVAHQGTNDRDKPGTLTFLNVNGRYQLIRVSTATFSMNMKSKKDRRGDLAKLSSSKPTMVSINLNK